MSLILAGALSGAGRGIAETGAAMGRWAAELEAMERRRQERLAELRELSALRTKEREDEARFRREDSERVLADGRRMFGVDDPAKTQADFTRTRKVGGQGDGGELVDEVTPDAEAYGKYRRERRENEMRAGAYAKNPATLDDIERTIAGSRLRDELAAAAGDPKKLQEIAQREAARQGKFDDPEDRRLKRELAQSAIDENRAQAARAGRDGAARPTTLRDANTEVETARRSLNDARRAATDVLMKENPKVMSMSPEERKRFIENDQTVRDAMDDYREAINNRDALRAGGATGAGGGDKAPAGRAPYPDGTRLQGKDGKTYVVRNGKPVLER